MKDKVIIFGNSDFAELVYTYMKYDSDFDIVAFCVDDEYVKSDKFCDLPLIPFSKINSYPPSEYKFFVAIGYLKLNSIRKDIYIRIKNLGYKFISYIHSSVILPKEYVIGENCMILDGNIIEPFAEIENNVFIWSKNLIAHNTLIKKHTFIASNVVIGGFTVVGEKSFVGLSSTLTDKIKIGSNCMIGAGSLILKNLEDNTVVINRGSKKSKITSDEFLEYGMGV